MCPYADCHKYFSEKSNLKTHLKTHTQEKPFKCSYPQCTMAFVTKGNMLDHLKRHNKIKYFNTLVYYFLTRINKIETFSASFARKPFIGRSRLSLTRQTAPSRKRRLRLRGMGRILTKRWTFKSRIRSVYPSLDHLMRNIQLKNSILRIQANRRESCPKTMYANL